MISRLRGCVVILLGTFFVLGAVWLSAQIKPPSSPAENRSSQRDKIALYIRERFGLPANVKLTVGPFRSSFDPNLFKATVTVDDGKQTKEQEILVSRDGRYLILGDVYNLADDPREVALRTISTRNQPSQGPGNAPVTIVEYADLQCPLCARLHEFIENQLLPKYPGKVRIVFKDFPLVAIHDWAQAASIASQCAYQISPEDFSAYRTLIFRNQAAINATNARDMLLNLASQAGIDSLKLAACLDSQASRPRVEQDVNEGKKLGVGSTPTSYVNGRLIVGMPTDEEFFKAIDEALRAAR